MQKIRIQELRKVESSNLDLIGFDVDKTFVQFKNGKLYEYPNTTKEEFLGLVNADSVGKQFFKSYKGKTEFTQLEDTILEKKIDKPLSLMEKIEDQLSIHQEHKNSAAIRSLKLLKAAVINNTKAKKPIKEDKLLKKYYSDLVSEKDSYEKANKNTNSICYEMLIVERFIPKEPLKMSDKDVQTAVLLHIGSQEYTKKDMGAIMRYMKTSLGNQNAQSISKYVKEALNG